MLRLILCKCILLSLTSISFPKFESLTILSSNLEKYISKYSFFTTLKTLARNKYTVIDNFLVEVLSKVYGKKIFAGNFFCLLN